MFTFANTEYIILLSAILPTLVIAYVYLHFKKKQRIKKLGNLPTIKQLMPEASPQRAHLKFWLTFVMIALCILMLARPQFGTKAQEIQKEGIEMVIAVDVSYSMLAQDITPSRLGKAKQLLSRIIDKRNGDKIAIVLFAGEAFTQMPLTADTQSAQIFLNSINPQSIPVAGTNIEAAIEKSLSSFSGDSELDKALILITDCENLEGEPIRAAKKAEKEGVYIHVIGIGTEQGAPIPLSNSFLTDTDGEVIISRFNEQDAKSIAEAANGFYAHADNSDSALNALLQQLQKLRTKEIGTIKYTEYDDKFPYLAWVILALLFLEVCIFEKKNRIWQKIRRYNFSNPNK